MLTPGLNLSFWTSKDIILHISRQKKPITHQKRKTQANLRLLSGNANAQKTAEQYLKTSRERKCVSQEPFTQPKCCSDIKAMDKPTTNTEVVRKYTTTNTSLENSFTSTSSQWRDEWDESKQTQECKYCSKRTSSEQWILLNMKLIPQLLDYGYESEWECSFEQRKQRTTWKQYYN